MAWTPGRPPWRSDTRRAMLLARGRSAFCSWQLKLLTHGPARGTNTSISHGLVACVQQPCMLLMRLQCTCPQGENAQAGVCMPGTILRQGAR